MPTWLRAIFERLARRVGGPHEREVAPWLELCAHAGLTPAAGPLAHDVLLPRPGRAQLGINVFGHGTLTQEVRQVALTFAAQLGGSALETTRQLAEADPDATWHGGFLHADGRTIMKLYLAASEPLAQHLGVADERAFALGVDVAEGGWSRARSYRWLDASHPLDLSDWPALDAWLALDEPVGHSHRVVAALANEKRSLSHIFGPEAPRSSLDAIASLVAAIDPECASCLDVALLDELEQIASNGGATLRPVAYEVDLFADGTRQTDALVTVAAK